MCKGIGIRTLSEGAESNISNASHDNIESWVQCLHTVTFPPK